MDKVDLGNITAHDGHYKQDGPARSDWQDQIKQTSGLYPDDWVEMSNKTPLQVATSPRAHYSHHNGVLAMDEEEVSPSLSGYTGGFASDAHEISAHEFGHRMESTVPGLTQLEFAYVRSRTTLPSGDLEPLEDMRNLYGGGYNAGEMARIDKFSNAYAGKEYASKYALDPGESPWEAFQVGIQQLYGGPRDFGGDDLTAFTFGVLATLHRKKVTA